MLDIANLSDIGEVMTSKNMMRIGAFLAGTGSNMASWRHPNAVADGAISLESVSYTHLTLPTTPYV